MKPIIFLSILTFFSVIAVIIFAFASGDTCVYNISVKACAMKSKTLLVLRDLISFDH